MIDKTRQIPWVADELANWAAWARGERLPGRCATLLGKLIRKRALELGLSTDEYILVDVLEDRAILVDAELSKMPVVLQRTAKHYYLRRRTKREVGDRLRVCERTVGVYIVRLHHMLGHSLQKTFGDTG